MEQGTDIESSLSKKKAMNGELESAGQATLIKKNDDPNMEVASIGSLFRFATTFDFIIFFLGFIFSIICSATMPAICIAFGDVIDSIAKPINTTEVLRDSVIFMALIGVYGLVTFFFAFFFAGWAASRIANSFRVQFLDAVLRQDATFFDRASPGSISLVLSDGAFDIQNGLADKFAGAIQGFCQFVFGFGIAFYYNLLLPLILLGCVPLLGGLSWAMTTWGASDGIFGKEAYGRAASIASETLSNFRTIFSLNAEPAMSKRYDAELGKSERAAVKQGARAALLTGCFMGVMWVMYGLGFWAGAVLVAKSTDEAIERNPAPAAFLDGTAPYVGHVSIIDEVCKGLTGEAFAVCACGLPWDTGELSGLESPKCGCGAYGTSQEDEAGRFTTTDGCFTGGRVTLVFFSIIIAAMSCGQIGPGLKAFNEARIAVAKMLKVIDRYPDIDVSKTKGKKRLDKESVKGEITLENMHFRYAPKGGSNDSPEELVEERRAVFGGCNLTMEAGQTVALVGESGCGKSTIAKLVQRFYDPTEGSILLDGVNLRDLALVDLRSVIGVVSQEPLLFDKSIKENIRYGKPGASDQDIVEAAKSANAHEFISNFPEGYDTAVGVRGCKLSGGQKQRVAIARAILRNPAILILDEATSALDNKSEKVVQQALDKLVEDNNKQRTTILIAHRLSTVRNADKIVVLGSPEGTSTASSGSQILEQGSHDELMAKPNGFYKALVGAGERRKSEAGFDVVAAESDLETIFDNKKTEEKDENEVVEDEKGFWEKVKGEKQSPEDIEKAKLDKIQAKENKRRVWKYSKPELPLIVVGSCASLIKGTFFPLLAIFFSELLVVLFESDTEVLRKDALKWSLVFYGLGIASGFFDFFQRAIYELIGERITTRLRSDTFRSMLRQDVTWFEHEDNAIGSLSSRLSTDVKLVRLVASQSLAASIESMSSLTTGIIICLIYSWEMFLIMIAIVPLLGITEGLQWMMLQGSEGDMRKELTKNTDILHETVNGIREVQSFALESFIAKEVKTSLFDTIAPASLKQAALKGFMMGMIQFVQFGVYALAFWFGGEMIESGRIDFEDFNKSLWAMAFAASGLGQAAIFAGDAAKASAAVKSTIGNLDLVSDIDSKPWENKGLAEVSTGGVIERELPKSILSGSVDLVDLNFAYPTRKGAKVFDEIGLSIPSGKVVALVGSSGSGKSTVIQLLERFYDPISYKEEVGIKGTTTSVKTEHNGHLLVDGEKLIDSDCRFVRKNMGLVGQEPVLFNDTVYNNIALGKSEGCTRAEVEEAARRANAYDFIMKLEDGFETMVGNAGGMVSGGQKQRIAIARALVSNPKVLLLDEATSALDNESEKIVQASLDNLVKESGGERTTIIIAHRLSTIKEADVICVLENKGGGSKVVERGTHDELMSLGQKYKALVQAYVK